VGSIAQGVDVCIRSAPIRPNVHTVVPDGRTRLPGNRAKKRGNASDVRYKIEATLPTGHESALRGAREELQSGPTALRETALEYTQIRDRAVISGGPNLCRAWRVLPPASPAPALRTAQNACAQRSFARPSGRLCRPAAGQASDDMAPVRTLRTSPQ